MRDSHSAERVRVYGMRTGISIDVSPASRARLVFKSIVDLQAAINRFLAETNDDPKPFTWTADSDQIIAAVRRGHRALDSIR